MTTFRYAPKHLVHVNLGAAALAGYTISIRVVLVVLLPSWGLCNAAATLVGQNLGARKPERAERAVWLTGLYNMGFLMLVGLAFVLFAETVVGLFTADAEVRRLGAECLRVVSYGYAAYAWGMVMVQAFNGAGDTVTPTWLNAICFWLLQLPLAYALAEWAALGPDGVFLSAAISESLLAVLAWWVFRRGGWKLKVV